MKQPPLFIFTSDKYDWIVPVALHQIKKYWEPLPPVIIAGFTPPACELPSWAEFYSIGSFEDYPVDRWSDGLIDFLHAIGDEYTHFILFHEDYLLVRQVDTRAIGLLYEHILERPEVIRVDLSTDRFYSKEAVEIGHLGHLDIIITPPPSAYQMSNQPGIFNIELLLQIERRGETPWESELEGTRRLNDRPDLIVLGTRQAPIRHVIAINKGKLDLWGSWQTPRPIPLVSDISELLEKFPYLKEKMEKQ